MGRQYYMSSVEMGEPTDDKLSSEQQGQELLYRNGSREVYLVPGTDLHGNRVDLAVRLSGEFSRILPLRSGPVMLGCCRSV